MNPDIAILSVKALAALGLSSFLAFSERMVAQIPGAPQDGLWQYGVLGIACIGLVYAIKTLHTINQQLLKDRIQDIKDAEAQRMADKVEAEKQRLADRDTFFNRLDTLFKSSETSRDNLAGKIESLIHKLDK